MAKKYSLAEIDQMRGHVARLFAGKRRWTAMADGGFYAPAPPEVSPGQVEDRLRTYMANGTTLLELQAAAADLNRAEAAQQAEARAEHERNPPKPVTGWQIKENVSAA